jgi:hypothetical protein
MLNINERICSARPLRGPPQSPLANADVRPKPNQKWASQWAQKLFPGFYPMKTTEAGGDGGIRTLGTSKPGTAV